MLSFREPEAFALDVMERRERKQHDKDEEEEEMEQSEEENNSVEAMDVSDGEEDNDDDAGFLVQFEFPFPSPPLHLAEGGVKFRFQADCIPVTFPVVSIQTMEALASINQMTASYKAQFADLPALPMPIHASPLVALIECKVGRGQTQLPWKPRYISWMMSMFQLAQFMELARSGIIPVPPNTKPTLADECGALFRHQVKRYKVMQYLRIRALHEQVRDNPSSLEQALQQFVSYLEDFSFYYIHSMERFLFQTILEPHHSETLLLEHVLTPRDKPTLSQCENQQAQQKLMAEFFQLKPHTFKDREEREDQERERRDYNALDTRQIPHRIEYNSMTNQIMVNVPEHTVYRGFIDRQTILEYFVFLDRDKVMREINV